MAHAPPYSGTCRLCTFTISAPSGGLNFTAPSGPLVGILRGLLALRGHHRCCSPRFALVFALPYPCFWYLLPAIFRLWPGPGWCSHPGLVCTCHPAFQHLACFPFNRAGGNQTPPCMLTAPQGHNGHGDQSQSPVAVGPWVGRTGLVDYATFGTKKKKPSHGCPWPATTGAMAGHSLSTTSTLCIDLY